MESLWEKITDLDKLNYATKVESPIVKSQFRLKKNALSSQKTSIQIHLYASLILFICANTPKAKITLTPDVQYQLNPENNILTIHKSEKSFQLRLNDSDNMNKWAEALTKLGITERYPLRNSQPQIPLEVLQSICPDNSDITLQQNTISSLYPSRRESQLAPSSRNISSLLESPQPPSFIITKDDNQNLIVSVSANSSCLTTNSSENPQENVHFKENNVNKHGKKSHQKINSKRKSSYQENLYAAPETLKPFMEHFMINTNYLYRKTCTNYFQYLTSLRGLEKIPEEQECCD